jgi:hypothetical protein
MFNFENIPIRSIFFLFFLALSFIDQPYIQNSVVPVILISWLMLLFDEIITIIFVPRPFDLGSSIFISNG